MATVAGGMDIQPCPKGASGKSIKHYARQGHVSLKLLAASQCLPVVPSFLENYDSSLCCFVLS